MRHAYKKVKFRKGQDATQMILVKLSYNFLTLGKIVLTDRKAKILRSHLERIVHKSISATQADKNMMLSKLHKSSLVNYLIDTVKPALMRETGFFTMEKIMHRKGDGAKMTKMTWKDEIPPFVRNVLKSTKLATNSEDKVKVSKVKTVKTDKTVSNEQNDEIK